MERASKIKAGQKKVPLLVSHLVSFVCLFCGLPSFTAADFDSLFCT